MSYIDPVTGIEEEEIEWGNDEDDIESLLGFDFDNAQSAQRSGLYALINSSLVSHPLQPALELIFDRMPGLFTTSLRHLANDTLDVSLETVATVRFGEFIENRTGPSVLGIFMSEGLDNFSLMNADATFVFSIVDFLLGGTRAQTASDDARTFTSIETALAKRIFVKLCDDLGTAFSGIVEAPFELDKVETKARFAAITRENSVCALAKFRVQIAEATGQLQILIPYANLDPVQEKLTHDYLHQRGSESDRWRDALEDRMQATYVDLHCVLDEKTMTLGEVSALKVGDVIGLGATLEQSVTLRAGRLDIAEGKIGRAGEMLAVRLYNKISATKSIDQNMDQIVKEALTKEQAHQLLDFQS